MSLPVPPQALTSLTVLNPIDGFLHFFNTNPYFIGLMMLILNIGGRFISLEVTKKQELFLQRPWVRRILIFTVLFVATRNIWVAFWLTLAVVLLLGYIFNENSSLCIFGNNGLKGSSCSTSSNSDKEADLTPEEKEILQRLTSKAQRFQQKSIDKGKDNTLDDIEHTDIYTANLSLLKQ